MDTALLKPKEMSVSVAEHRARVVENLEIARRIADENNTIDALRNGFALIMEPLINYELANSRTLQLQFLLTLPTLDTSRAFCTMEQLVPIAYQVNNKCFGGTIARHDLVY